MLHAHARANNISALEACLDANPSQVDLQDADGNTPLLAAVQTNSTRRITEARRPYTSASRSATTSSASTS